VPKIKARSLLMFALGITALAQAFGQQPAPATIQVYRPKAKIMARGVHPSIYLDGVELYRLHQGTFFMAIVPAGKHLVTAGRSEVGQLVEMEPGKHYYFRFGHRNLLLSGFSGSQPITLSLVSEDEARSEIQGLDDVTKHEGK
jgi:hypothetical protein